MAAIFDHDEPRTGDAGRDLLAQRERRERVFAAADHERRAADLRQRRPAVGAADDRFLLAHVAFAADRAGHRRDRGYEAGVVEARRVHEPRQEGTHHGVEVARRLRDRGAAHGGLLGRVGPGAGVEQGERGDALRRLPHDLQRQVAAHRQAGQGEASGRRLRERGRGQRGHRVVPGQGERRDRMLGEEVGRLVLPQAFVAEEAGQGEQRKSGHRESGFRTLQAAFRPAKD